MLTGPRLDSGLRGADEFRGLVATYEAIGVTDLVVHWPRPGPPYAGKEALLEAVAPNR